MVLKWMKRHKKLMITLCLLCVAILGHRRWISGTLELDEAVYKRIDISKIVAGIDKLDGYFYNHGVRYLSNSNRKISSEDKNVLHMVGGGARGGYTAHLLVIVDDMENISNDFQYHIDYQRHAGLRIQYHVSCGFLLWNEDIELGIFTMLEPNEARDLFEDVLNEIMDIVEQT